MGYAVKRKHQRQPKPPCYVSYRRQSIKNTRKIADMTPIPCRWSVYAFVWRFPPTRLILDPPPAMRLHAICVKLWPLTLIDLWPTFQGHGSTPFAITYHLSIISISDLGWPWMTLNLIPNFFSVKTFLVEKQVLGLWKFFGCWPWMTFRNKIWVEKKFRWKIFLGLWKFFGGVIFFFSDMTYYLK